MLKLKSISDKNNISLDLVCYLQSVTIEEDDIGNQIETPVNRQIFCAELPLNSSEYFNAGLQEIKPEHLLVADLEEYDNEATVLYQDIAYSIYRVYPRSDSLIELYCNKKAGV